MRARSLLPRPPPEVDGKPPLVFKVSYNPLWDQMDFGPIWKVLRHEFEAAGFFDERDRFILSRSKASSLGDLANAGNKKSLARQA